MNLTEEAGKQIEALVREACASAVKKGLLPAGTELKGTAEVPRDPARGDFACSCAMRAAGTVGMSSRKLAGTLRPDPAGHRNHGPHTEENAGNCYFCLDIRYNLLYCCLLWIGGLYGK